VADKLWFMTHIRVEEEDWGVDVMEVIYCFNRTMSIVVVIQINQSMWTDATDAGTLYVRIDQCRDFNMSTSRGQSLGGKLK